MISQIIILLLLNSCGSSSSEKQMTTNKDANSKKSTSSCLDKYIEDPCAMFTVQSFAQIADIDLSKVAMEEPLKFDFMKRTSCFYKWNSGRTGQVKTGIGMIVIDLDESVSIGNITVIDDNEANGSYTDWFDKKYRSLTPEEIESYEAMYQERLAKENEEVQKAAGSMKSILTKSKMVKIEDVGDRAVVETLGKLADVTLQALHGNTVFTVTANISDDQDINIEIAKKIARAVIQLCN